MTTVPAAPAARPGWPALLPAAVVALALGLGLPQPLRLWLHQAGAIPLALLTTLAVAGAAVAWCRAEWRAPDRRRQLLLQAAAAALVTGVIAWWVPARALIEADGSAFAITADAIRYTRAIEVPNAGIVDAGGILHPTLLNLEKRGVLYSLQAALLAPLAGSALAAAGWLNLLYGGVFLLALGRLAAAIAGPLAAAPAMLLAATYPVLQLCIRGNTYDIANAALLLALAASLLRAWTKPRPPALGAVLVLALAVAQLRYESILPAALALGLLALRLLADPATTATTRRLALGLPLVLVPVAWRLAVPIDAELPPTVTAVWGLDHLRANVVAFGSWLLDPAWRKIGSPWVGWLALLGLLHLGWRGRQRLTPAAGAAALVLLAPLALLLPNYWGQASNPLTVRYFLPAVALAALLAVLPLAVLARGRLAALALLLAGATLATAAVQRTRHGWDGVFPLSTYRDLVLDWLAGMPRRCSVVLVGDYPSLFLAHGHSAVHPGHWVRLAESGELLRRIGVNAVVAPLLEPADGRAVTLPPYLDGQSPVRRLAAHGVQVGLYELWRDQPDAGCVPRLPLRGVDPVDLRGADRLWLIAPLP